MKPTFLSICFVASHLSRQFLPTIPSLPQELGLGQRRAGFERSASAARRLGALSGFDFILALEGVYYGSRWSFRLNHRVALRGTTEKCAKFRRPVLHRCATRCAHISDTLAGPLPAPRGATMAMQTFEISDEPNNIFFSLLSQLTAHDMIQCRQSADNHHGGPLHDVDTK